MTEYFSWVPDDEVNYFIDTQRDNKYRPLITLVGRRIESIAVHLPTRQGESPSITIGVEEEGE